MLDLVQSLVGSAKAGAQYLFLPNVSLILYASADTVVAVNARTLELVRVLPFSEVFPATRNTKQSVACISVDVGMKLVVASMNHRIAAWSISGVNSDIWRVHSSLVLSPDQAVTTLDNKSGLLAVGTQATLAVYTLVLDNDLLTWSQKWTSRIPTPTLGRFAPSLMYIVTTSRNNNDVRTYSTTTGRQTQLISHPRLVTNVAWRHSQASSRDDLILYTVTSDSTLRIFLPVLDSPQYLQLHASLDLFSSLPFSAAQTFRESTVFWLDREIIGDSLRQVLQSETQHNLDESRIRKIREIVDQGWDVFLRVLGNGSVVITAVANIDRRPPTLIDQFTLEHSPPGMLPTSPQHVYIVPNPGKNTITLVTSPPLATYDLDPLNFFTGHIDGLKAQKSGLCSVPEEDAHIQRLVRRSDGSAVAVLRSDGLGEVWKMSSAGSSLVRGDQYSSADLIVLLKGSSFAKYSASDSTLTLHSNPPISLAIPAVDSLFSYPTEGLGEAIVGITPDHSIVSIQVNEMAKMAISSHAYLPLPSPPIMILPVDPMAWGYEKSYAVHDVLLSVSDAGELAFWVPDTNFKWICTGKINTRRTGTRLARCSSAKKSALVVPGSDGDELTIWDSKASEFASGLEYRRFFDSSNFVNDLDWTSTPDNQSILAVGFAHHVELLSQQRMTYFDEEPGWTMCHRVEIGNFISHPISDSIWLANGSLLVAAGHQMLMFGSSDSTEKSSGTIFEDVAKHNGPLDDHHPQMILQCLLWDKVELVKDIIINLSRDVERPEWPNNAWTSLPTELFLRKGQTSQPNMKRPSHRRYNTLFTASGQKDDSEEDEGFCRPLVTRLIDLLETKPLPHLTPNENAHLLVLIQTTLEIDEQRRALDANGLRYLISMRSFYILNDRASAPPSPESSGLVRRSTGRRERLRYRDIVWAFHSESQELLLAASTSACGGKMCWADARALGISLWVTSVDTLKSQLEIVARNEYMAGDDRDPTACSLLYFALGKVKLVHSLWRQAPWHKEQAVMLKFLSNDFTQARWRTAALKNAYALLSKRRFEYAAAFFLLGNSLKDAVNVCIKQMGDFQLAVALARVVEHSNEGPVLIDILQNTVLPIVFADGNRYLGSWAFWLLHRRDMAVRILVTPLQDIARSWNIEPPEFGEPHYDDTGLALLFSHLKSKTLQAAKGTSEISGSAEFNFVLQIARVFCRMGCQVLALDLVQAWSFARPSVASRQPYVRSNVRPELSFQSHRRRSSMLIDMDIPSNPPTRAVSPDTIPQKPPPIPEGVEEQSDLKARRAGLGSLMKSAKEDVKVPEFDMSSFF